MKESASFSSAELCRTYLSEHGGLSNVAGSSGRIILQGDGRVGVERGLSKRINLVGVLPDLRVGICIGHRNPDKISSGDGDFIAVQTSGRGSCSSASNDAGALVDNTGNQNCAWLWTYCGDQNTPEERVS